ncbi:phosphotransferase family protein [Bacillus sp. AFS055030]|uniref:phosphotransferase family protein n=1 Tax=Bacillus sp. AFS055030 TaxID=2033507 RepID=UPI0025707D1C|nr:phosphotransferase family protein [Bacillus sp. AFS055030]
MNKELDANTILVGGMDELNWEAIRKYLQKHIDGIPDQPLTVRQFQAGASNLTYLIQCGDWEAVMRRPPSGPLPPKAHDMGRESKIMSRLYPFFSYVPKPYVICEDESIIGVPFYVMERKNGLVLDKEFPKGKSFSDDDCKQVSYLAVDTLAELHSVDIKESKLDEFGRPERFVERQIHSWIKRFQLCKTEEISPFDQISKWLIENIPPSSDAVLIHNDYKLNNMLISNDLQRVEAVVDWELAAIADPLFDLGTTLGYWIQHDDPELIKLGIPSITAHSSFISRREFVERYAKKTKRDVSNIHFYLTFSYFRIAIAMQQMYYRWKIGATKDERFATFNHTVKVFMEHANEHSQQKSDFSL